MNQKISVIICTYNGEEIISRCLNSVLSQNYKNFEVLCVDGGSTDKTLEIIKNYKDSRIKIVHNKNRLPEGIYNGKWLGFKKAKGEIIGILDQDNELERKDLFSQVISIFKEEKDILGILGGLKHNKHSKQITRYISLVGTDSFFSYRSVDFLRNIRNYSINEDLEEINIDKNQLLLSGGNCFFYKKTDLTKIGGYTQDVINVKKIVNLGKTKLKIIKNATTHYSEDSFLKLIKKKFRWGKNYFKIKTQNSFNYFPINNKERISFFRTILFNFLILPNIYYSVKLYTKSKDFVSFLFPIIAAINTFAYLLNTFRNILIFNFIKH